MSACPRPEQTSDLEEIVRKEDIEGRILCHNKKHHQQVYDNNSPHVTGTIEEIFKDKETINNILEGHTDADDLDIPYYTKDWFRALTKTSAEQNLLCFNSVVSAKRYAEVFKEADEKKSSSPEGLHYILWKYLAEVEDYCSFLCVMMSLPFMYGFANKRWQRAIDAMLEKITGVHHIHLSESLGLSSPTTTVG